MMKLKALILALRNKEPLCEITLERFSDASNKDVNSFIRRLQKSKIRKISVRTDFFMGRSEEQVEAFFDALANMSNLEDLCIQSSSRFHVQIIPRRAITALRQATKLETLSLEDLQVTALHIDFIAALANLVEGHPSLKNISLSNFFANDWANTEANILDPLVCALATTPNLENLKLSGCGSHALSGRRVQLLSPAVLSRLFLSKKLTSLDFSFLEMDDTHFHEIAEHLRINEQLTDLTLDYHRLENQGFEELMRSMKENITIKSLSLRSLSDIGGEGFRHAMKMLQKNYSIESLSVTASPHHQAEIDLYLRMNSVGRNLLRMPNTSLNQWIEVLAKASDDLDVTRHLLQEIPELCNSAALA